MEIEQQLRWRVQEMSSPFFLILAITVIGRISTPDLRDRNR